jgi:hypothetical protein
MRYSSNSHIEEKKQLVIDPKNLIRKTEPASSSFVKSFITTQPKYNQFSTNKQPFTTIDTPPREEYHLKKS